MKLICQWHCLAYHPWALWELINACKSPGELQRKDVLCMQSPAAFRRCRLHTCARCIMCRLCLVAERLLCTYGLGMIDGWIGLPTLEALPCQRGACPHMSVHHKPLSSGTVVRFPKTMITFPQKQASNLTPFLAGLFCRALFPASQGSCETSFLHVCKTRQEPTWKCKERVVHALFLWWLLENNYSHAKRPACTTKVTTPPQGRMAELEVLARRVRWDFSTFKVVNSNLRGPERAWRPRQLLWRELQMCRGCNPGAEKTLRYQILLTLKMSPTYSKLK